MKIYRQGDVMLVRLENAQIAKDKAKQHGRS